MKIVQHFKRELVSEEELQKDPNKYLYEIIGTATHTETADQLVIYRALYGSKNLFARPASMFNSKVDKDKYPNVKQEYRFKEIDPNNWYAGDLS